MNILELCDRFSITKRALYNRFDAVKIKPQIGADNKAYVTPAQLAILDDLSAHLKAGGNLKNYTPVSPVAKQSEVTTTHREVETTPKEEVSKDVTYQELQAQELQQRSPGAELGILGTSEVVTTLVEVLGAISKKLHDPLKKHEQLKQAAVEGWILTTSEIEEVIGVKPSGDSYVRGNWKFVRRGKIGRESAWEVVNIDKSIPNPDGDWSFRVGENGFSGDLHFLFKTLGSVFDGELTYIAGENELSKEDFDDYKKAVWNYCLITGGASGGTDWSIEYLGG
jgi:hypothetical protein